MTTNINWMPHALRPALLRLSKADSLIEQIATDCLAWSRGTDNLGALRLEEIEAQPGQLGLIVAEIRPIPPCIAIAFSEAIHHLRGALENCVYILTSSMHDKSLTPEQERAIAFPIYDDESKFNSWRGRFQKLGLEVLASGGVLGDRLAGLQPTADTSAVPSVGEPLSSLMGINADQAHPLTLLQGYSNVDKHRELLIAAARAMIQNHAEPFWTSDRTMRPLAVGDVLSTTAKGVPTIIETNAAVHVQRPDSDTWVAPATELSHLYDHVVDVAIPTLVTGLAAPGSLPARIALNDSGLTLDQRVEAATWERARQRINRLMTEAYAESLDVPLQFPTNRDLPEA